MSPSSDFLELLPESQYGFIYHYYRAEVYRETNWRNRMDVTTNWAIGTTGAILSLVFSSSGMPHTLILMNFLIVLFFLYIESRRFRYYQILKQRTRLIEQHLLSTIFTDKSTKHTNDSWTTALHDSFMKPTVSMSRTESIAWRLRRNYIFLLPIIFIAWVMKITSGPLVVSTVADAMKNARVWIFPGGVVFSFLLVFIIYLTIISFTIPRQSAEDDLP